MPERYYTDSSYGAGSRRERLGVMQRSRETIDYAHGSSYIAPRYRSVGGYGGGGSINSTMASYGLGATAPSYGSASTYGSTANYGSSSGYGGSSAYDGGTSYGSSASYGDATYGGSSAYSHAGYVSRQVVSPWETGMAPALAAGNQAGFLPTPRGSGGLMDSGRSSDIVGAVNTLTHMGSTESKLALNILNAVLSTGSGGDGRSNMDIGPPAHKMRRIEWDGGHGNRRGQTLSSPVHPSPVRKFPQRDQQYNTRRSWDNESSQRGRGGNSFGSAGRHMPDNQLRKTAKAKRGKPKSDLKDVKGPAKDQKKVKSEEKPDKTNGTASGQKGNKAEGGGSSAVAKKSGTTDSKNEVEQSDEATDDKENAEEMDTTENEEDKDIKTKKDSFVPKEILKCHMCDVDNFYSINCYQKHLESKAHKTTAHAYHGQGAAILEILRAEAKLACQRQILSAWKGGARGNLMQCGKCQCKIAGTLQEHNKTIEHSLISQYLKVKCCGHAYTIRGALEEHRLSLLHFKWQMEMEQEIKAREEKKLEQEKEISEEEILKKFHAAVEEFKANNSEEVLTSETLPPFDPAVPVGMHLVGTKSHYRCKVCPGPRFRMVDEQQVHVHFRSIVHYQNLFAHVTQMQEQKDLEKKKKLEEKRKEQEKEKSENQPEGEKQADEAEKDDTAVKQSTDDEGEDADAGDVEEEEAGDEDDEDAGGEDADADEEAEVDDGTDPEGKDKESTQKINKSNAADNEKTAELDDESAMLEEVGEAFDEEGDVENAEQEDNDDNFADAEEGPEQKLEEECVIEEEPEENAEKAEEIPKTEEETAKADKDQPKSDVGTPRARRAARGRGRGRSVKN